MYKILLITNKNYTEKFVSKGFASGFRANGCYILTKELNDLQIADIERFKPDIIFGYNYGFLLQGRMEIIDYIIENKGKFKLVNYFADEPDSRYAYLNKPELFEEYKKLSADRSNVFTFLWDKEAAEQIKGSKYLPLAVNYKAYRAEEKKPLDISFVGRPLTQKRQEILAALIKSFGKKVNIFCYENHFLQSLDDMEQKQLLSEEELNTYKSAYRGFLKSEKEIADVYFNSKVNINITLQGKSGLNYRVYEVLASRGFLLTDEREDITKNFIVSKELETYKDINDLIDKTQFYLKHPDIAQKIAIIGYADVVKSHSYTARARYILDTIKQAVQK